MNKKKFWYVFNATRRGVPHVKHESREKAIREAGRLARQQPGDEFYVLSAVVHVVAPRPTYVVTPL